MALGRNVKSIVHFMAYPGPRSTTPVLRGEADARYLLGTMAKILEDDYFGAIEVTRIKDSVVRSRAAQLLRDSGKQVLYGAQPVQLINEDDLVSPNDVSAVDDVCRRQAVERCMECMDEAYALGAEQFLISGRDPGTSSGTREREKAKLSLVRSLDELCRYAVEKAHDLGREPVRVTLELFDRLDEDGCKNQLIGPVSDALEIAEALRVSYGHHHFGILYDLSHMPLTRDVSFSSETPEVIKSVAPYLNHVHIGNCVVDRDDPLFGDHHVPFGYTKGAVDSRLLAEFVKALHESEYTGSIGFEVTPLPEDVPETVIEMTKTHFDAARNRIDVNYSLRSFVFSYRRFFPEALFDQITELRVNEPGIIEEEARSRQKRKTLTRDGRLLILAADHPGRAVTGVGQEEVRMGDRREYLARIVRVLACSDVDGVMTTPDVMEDLLILNRIYSRAHGHGLLDERVLVGSMNRGGIAGSSYEMDDRMTGFTAERARDLSLDGTKLMVRLDMESRYSIQTLDRCADAITRCTRYGLAVFLEPLPVVRTESGYKVVMDTENLIKTVGVGSALGESSSSLWLKIPFVDGYEEVVRATSLPILMLGGESRMNPLGTLEDFEKGLGAGRNVRGALVGRNVLYPGYDDPMAVAAAVGGLIHKECTTEEGVAMLVEQRGSRFDLFSRLVQPSEGGE